MEEIVSDADRDRGVTAGGLPNLNNFLDLPHLCFMETLLMTQLVYMTFSTLSVPTIISLSIQKQLF